jgi:hypothetical protein
MSLSKIKCWHANNCLHFLKCAVQLLEVLQVVNSTLVIGPHLQLLNSQTLLLIGDQRYKGISPCKVTDFWIFSLIESNLIIPLSSISSSTSSTLANSSRASAMYKKVSCHRWHEMSSAFGFNA